MGKRGSKRGRGGGGTRRGGNRRGHDERASYQEVTKENRLYELYYNELGVVEEGERQAFWDALRRDLPSSFRFTGSKGHALAVQQRLQDYYIPQITSIEHEGQLVAPPTPIPWYPDQLAWQMTTPKSVIRRFPPFASFQKYLVSETSVGNINRQEAVSMIPPLLMDIHPGMTVLDMCAAPGSKSAQLIEMIHAGEESAMRYVSKHLRTRDEETAKLKAENSHVKLEDNTLEGKWFDDGRSTGLLIANDADYKRAHMLIHQMKRLNSPNLIVTNHDATMFPSIKLPSLPAPEGVQPKGRYLKFDRILADVPCSGDGTARKNSGVWKDWGPGTSLGLFNIQLRILFRALQMLKVGGRVVYSTCSMNPVENEAVISAAIKRAGGKDIINLVDCSGEMPLLQRRPGLRRWKIMDKQGSIWSSWQDVETRREEQGSGGLGKLVEDMFPFAADSEEEELPLERCMRVYPHLQDTGGFFITVLEKKAGIKNIKGEALPKKALEGAKGTVKATPEPLTSIVAVAEEIDAQPADSTRPIEKLSTLDDILPPITDEIDRNPSAAARQNKENPLVEYVSAEKHQLDDIGDSSAGTKKPRIRGDDDVAAPRGMENRQIHYPPPPGAVLGLTGRIDERPSPPPESMPAPDSLPIPATSTDQATVSDPPQLLGTSTVDGQYKAKNRTPVEEPFKYLDPNQEDLRVIYEFYQLDLRFPRDRFMVRNASGSATKTIYYTTAIAKDILTENEGKGMKFVHCGIKMFVKQDVQREGVCKWRIQTEGLPILESWVGDERVVRMRSRHTFKVLLKEMFPKVSQYGWKELGEIGERVRDIEMGCCVLRVEASEAEDGFREPLVLPLWRSLHSVNLMLPKEDRSAMLLRLYNETGPILNHSQGQPVPRDDGLDGEHAALVKAEAEMQGKDEARKDVQNKENVNTEDVYMKDVDMDGDGGITVKSDSDIESV